MIKLKKASKNSIKEYTIHLSKFFVNTLIEFGWSKRDAIEHASETLNISTVYDILDKDNHVGWAEVVPKTHVVVVPFLYIKDKKKGYGEAFVNYLQKEYPNKKIHSMVSSLNEPSKKLHHKMGFEVMGYIMEKSNK